VSNQPEFFEKPKIENVYYRHSKAKPKLRPTKITYVEDLEKKYSHLFEDEERPKENFNNSYYY
jgi:hypothetical protein